jgi:hypothetical protein
MINVKQHELIAELFQTLKAQFPEIELLNVTESPEDPNDLWVNITAPEDEDREIALTELASDKTADMLLDYGYYISIMPRHVKPPQTVRQAHQREGVHA